MPIQRSRSISLICIATLTGAAYLFGWSTMLSVKEITIIGAPTMTLEKVVGRDCGITVGKQLARIEPRVSSRALQVHPWIERSEISRNWWSKKVSVRVWPRTPIAYFNAGFIDASGVFFNLPVTQALSLPRMIAPSSGQRGVAVKIMTKLPKNMRDSLQEISFRNAQSAKLLIHDATLDRDLEITWGDSSQNELKVKVYRALIERGENRKINTMDLSAPETPIVR